MQASPSTTLKYDLINQKTFRNASVYCQERTYEPNAPPRKVIIFFLKDERFSFRLYFFGANFALESRGFGKTSGEKESVKSFVNISYKAQAVLEKIYQARTICQRRSNTAHQRPILRHQAESTVRQKPAYSTDDCFKSGMTLTY